LNLPGMARLTAAAALAATGGLVLGWLGPAAIRGGLAGSLALFALLLPLGLGLRGLLLGRLRTGRWLSLVLPFYCAFFLVAATGNPQVRGWVTAGAFCAALGFAAVLSWVRRAGQPAPPR
jgi:uncharacterized membrane protein